MRRGLGALPLSWFLTTPCPLCRAAKPPQDPVLAPCGCCRERLFLTDRGLKGRHPLDWWGVGSYAGDLRQLLLRQRRQPDRKTIGALVMGLDPAPFQGSQRPVLVPIPSWKRVSNPLPALVCAEIARQRGLRQDDLLVRSRPVLGQHHLNRRLRLANQKGAFRCSRPPLAGQVQRSPVLIVDDILTTGATAWNAALTLQQAGWRVIGLICLARTPAQPPRIVTYTSEVASAASRDSSVGRAGD